MARREIENIRGRDGCAGRIIRSHKDHAGNHTAANTHYRTVHAGTVVVHQGHIAVRRARTIARDYGGPIDTISINPRSGR